MPLRRQTLRVQLAGSAEILTVEAINPDYLRIEADMPRFGLTQSPKAAPMTYMTCLAWAALKRTGAYDGSLVDFKSRDCELLDVDNDDDDQADDDDEVRPTTRAADIVSRLPLASDTPGDQVSGSAVPTTG